MISFMLHSRAVIADCQWECGGGLSGFSLLSEPQAVTDWLVPTYEGIRLVSPTRRARHCCRAL